MSQPLPDRVTVLGAGTMGAGIALVFARMGSHVVLHARRRSTLERARSRIRSTLTALESDAGASETESRISFTRSLARSVRDTGLVVESVVEQLEAKQMLLARVEKLVPRGILLATNTSSLALAELGSVLERPDAFAGWHWFNPPELVDLVEVVAGPATAPENVEVLVEWSESLKKVPVVVRRDVPGFVANRLQYALIREAYSLVDTGVASHAEVDAAVRFGLGPRWAAVGPFESMDLAGLDVHHQVASRLFPTLANGAEPPDSLTRLVAEGSLGAKTRRGLRGRYDRTSLADLERRRAAILLALSARRRVDGEDIGS